MWDLCFVKMGAALRHGERWSIRLPLVLLLMQSLLALHFTWSRSFFVVLQITFLTSYTKSQPTISFIQFCSQFVHYHLPPTTAKKTGTVKANAYFLRDMCNSAMIRCWSCVITRQLNGLAEDINCLLRCPWAHRHLQMANISQIIHVLFNLSQPVGQLCCLSAIDCYCSFWDLNWQAPEDCMSGFDCATRALAHVIFSACWIHNLSVTQGIHRLHWSLDGGDANNSEGLVCMIAWCLCCIDSYRTRKLSIQQTCALLICLYFQFTI